MSVQSALKKLITIEKDMIMGARELREAEVRFLVDLFYEMQHFRIASANQLRSVQGTDEPHGVLQVVNQHSAALEELVAARFEPFVMSTAPGRWMLAQLGVGPVLAANMLAHLDITKAQTAGAFWRFAGFDPSAKWEKGQKRPHNARLKTACWKLTDVWVKLGTRDDAFYAQIYRLRKELEIQRNETGQFVDQAAAALKRKRFGVNTQARKHYEAGRLSPAHIDARARRYAAKLFLAHLHHVMFEDHYGTPPPKPYVLEHGGHVHCIEPPRWREMRQAQAAAA